METRLLCTLTHKCLSSISFIEELGCIIHRKKSNIVDLVDMNKPKETNIILTNNKCIPKYLFVLYRNGNIKHFLTGKCIKASGE